MRLSDSSSNYTVLSCCDALLIINSGNADLLPTFINLPTKVTGQPPATTTKQCNQSQTDAQASKSGTQMEENEMVVGCCLSKCEQLLGAITSHKRLLVWRCREQATWHLLRCWQLVKRPVDLTFDAQSRHVLVADKTGDVLHFSFDETSKDQVSAAVSLEEQEDHTPAPVLLGHLSMLLSVAMSECGRYIASGDRDEKIRVSSYPRAYNIASFCLGHSEFVSQLRTLPSFPGTLLSASGDGTLRLWNMEDGKELNVRDTHQHSHPMAVATSQTEHHTAPPDTQHNEDLKNNQDNNNHSCQEDSESPPGSTNGRDRVVPEQCAVVSVAVTTDPSSGGGDVVAVVFDKSCALVLYRVGADKTFRFHCQASLPRPASTVCWLSRDTLVTVCSPMTSASAAEPCSNASEDSSPVLVWQLREESLTCVPQHPLSVFAVQHRQRFQGVCAVDTHVLYKQRYDNVADYQKKKQERLEQQAQHQKQVQEQQLLRRAKRMRMCSSAEDVS